MTIKTNQFFDSRSLAQKLSGSRWTKSKLCVAAHQINTDGVPESMLDDAKLLVEACESINGENGRSEKARQVVADSVIVRDRLAAAVLAYEAPEDETEAETDTDDDAKAETDTAKRVRRRQVAAGNGSPRTGSAKAKRATDEYGDHPAIEGDGLCLCGCGNPLTKQGKQKFLSGHDARLAGIGKAVLAGFLPEDKLTTAALQYMVDWDKKFDADAHARFREMLNKRQVAAAS